MHSPWERPKPTQLDLLRVDPSGSSVTEHSLKDQRMDGPPATPATAADPDALAAGGRPLTVALSALYEDPDNPRTEFPEQEISELAEDIRHHGILQPIVVHPVDAAGKYRIHFGAKRFRAAGRAGLAVVPVVVREAAADPYAQVAENQKRHGLSPLDLARFIRSRVDLGETHATIASRLGMDLTTLAHHVALLDLPAPLDAALKSGRCAAPRTLYELSKVHAESPEAVVELLQGEQPITRAAVASLRPAVHRKKSVKRPAARRKPVCATPDPSQLATRAERLCTQLAATCSQLRSAGLEHVPIAQLATLRDRVVNVEGLLEP